MTFETRTHLFTQRILCLNFIFIFFSCCRGRRRPRIFKLKFHHQALPPEYLDHYEASLRQEQRQGIVPPTDGFRETRAGPRETITQGLQSGLRNNNKSRSGRNQRSSRPITIHEAGGAAATEALLRDLLLASPHLQQAALQQAAIARAQSVPSIMLASVAHNPRMSFPNGSLNVPSPDGSIMADDRSSYASDMSIDESPKRGRKPKKGLDPAYLMGRGLGGAGLGNSGAELEAEKSASQMTITEDSAEALARSRSFTSLLYAAPFDQSEPLNLCVRDESPQGGEFPLTPPCDTNECEISGIKREPLTEEENKSSGDTNDQRRNNTSSDPHTPCSPSDYPSWNLGCNYLGGAPHWIHDYRLKNEDGLSSGQSTPSLCSQSSHLPCMSPPTWPHLSPPPQMPSPHPMSPAPPLSPLMHSSNPRQLQAFIKESLQQRFEEAAKEQLSPRESFSSRRSERGSPFTPGSRDSPVKSGARRKRSALFIPPADPSTEVSICKFKFTGGANPMLEEKNMISVDAGGTLRCFSGGDRTLSKNRNNSPNLRLSGKLLENLSKCEKDVKKIRLESDTDDTCSLPGGRLEASCSSATTSPTGTLEYGVQSPLGFSSPLEDSPKRKRRSKKSSVREKLEQTLREKGLLIQTQQVESAEGATYCKFRQLRKFTRYLFRSWKDYLPGQMHEGVPGEHNLHNPRSPEYEAPTSLHGTPISSREYASSGH